MEGCGAGGSEDLELIVRLINTQAPGAIVTSWRVPWHKNSHVTKLDVRHKSRISLEIMRLHVSTSKTDDFLMKRSQIPEVLDVWSSPFRLNVDCSALDFVERKLRLSNETSIDIWEATRESIARHIWDGALGCLQLYKHTLLLKDAVIMMPLFHQLLVGENRKDIKVVELGSGCGVAGIALAQIVPGSSVLLTDLEAAQEILTKNIDNASLPERSSLQQEVLDWNEPLSASKPHSNIDLLIVCECIYNADSCPTLIGILQQFMAFSPKIKILVVTKRRHDSETVFFDLMSKAGIQMLEQCVVPLPHHISDADPDTPQAEIYLYGASQGLASERELIRDIRKPQLDNGDSPVRPKKRPRMVKAADVD